ncbi:GatB/YqeY domain-containing protein [Candidatus Microgenomates bacterium]|nr:MAG: GatB/YqeY domain-containing protein [Candidatus Microgenomates bacterium]
MLFEQIQIDLVAAMKSQNKPKIDTLRFLLAAIKKYEIDAYPPTSDKKLTEEDVVKIIQKQIKTHRESIEAFQKGGRNDLVEKEQAELAILQTYVPKELTDDEIQAIVVKIKSSSVANFGQVMGMVMKEVAGRADGTRVVKIVNTALKS